MFLDSDVLLAPNSLVPLLAKLKRDGSLGMLGIRYEPLATHVKMGATMMRAAVAKGIDWKFENDKCECVCAAESVKALDLQVKHHDSLQAYHLKYF